MTRRFGREATTYLAEPLLAGIHAGDVDRLSVQALFPRFVEAEREHGSLLRAFRLRRPAASSDGAFHSLPGGLSEMIRALVTAIGESRVRLGVGVAAIEGGGPFQVRTDRRRGRAGAGGHPRDPRIRHERVDRRSRRRRCPRLCGEIPYASAATIALAFDRDAIDHPLNGSGFVVPRVGADRTAGGLVAVVQMAESRAGGPGAVADVRRRSARSAGARALRRRTRRTVARGVEAAHRRSWRAAVHARVPLDARQRAARSRSPRADGGDRPCARSSIPACSSPAAAFAVSASRTASPTRDEPPTPCATGSRTKHPGVGNLKPRGQLPTLKVNAQLSNLNSEI